jgi:hypothetical protein
MDGWRRSLIERWPALDRLLGSAGGGRVAVATGLLLCLGISAVAESVSAVDAAPGPRDAVTVDAAIVARAQDKAAQAASRSGREGPLAAQSAAKPQAAKAPAQKAPGQRAKTAPGKGATAVKARPVAGLDQSQMDNAAAIVRTAQQMKLPKRAAVIAVATAMQESQLYNLASDVLPESKRYPHQGSGMDHDSVGLFQQRSSTGWGPIKELMTPELSARKFLAALSQVPGWQQMDLTYAAQAVQYSAFPEAYAKHEYRATVVVNTLN